MPVIQLDDLPTERVVAHDGVGRIDFVRITDRVPLRGVWEFVDFARVPPGCTVGLHEHADDEELYVVLRGTGVVTVNGVDERIDARCILANPPFAVHGIRNDGTEPLEFVVLKVPARAGISADAGGQVERR
jgi:mannose-6-phosphate isomerase-like protein (cupin superfamily)